MGEAKCSEHLGQLLSCDALVLVFYSLESVLQFLAMGGHEIGNVVERFSFLLLIE